jgi:hypothetical protein
MTAPTDKMTVPKICHNCRLHALCVVRREFLTRDADYLLKTITESPDDYADVRKAIGEALAANCKSYT